MALYDGFFDATYNEETQEYDRAYGSDDFTNYFGNVIGSGVCIHNNPDSFKAEYEGGTLYLRPGYLFIRGYWLANKAGEGETNYKGYAVTIPSGTTGSVAIVARLNMGSRMIELKVVSVASSYPDSLVLAIVDTAASTVQDTRHDKDLCGIIDTAGELSSKVDWAISYINNEIEGKLAQVEAEIAAKQAELDQEIAAQEAELDAKINEAQQKIDSIIPDPIGTIKFSAAETMGANWLMCNGDFISTEDYPELVEMIGKLEPNLEEDFQMLSNGEIGAQISNGVVYNGRMWVYSYANKKLYGVDLEGNGEIKEISLTSSNSNFNNFKPPSTTYPISLSIVIPKSLSSKYLFLGQVLTIDESNDSVTTTDYDWMNSFLLFRAVFNENSSSLSMEPAFVYAMDKTYPDNTPNVYNYGLKNSVLYVTSWVESGVEKFYVPAVRNKMQNGPYCMIQFDPSPGNLALIYELNFSFREMMRLSYQRFALSKKNKGELVAVLGQSGGPYDVCSAPSEIFSYDGGYNNFYYTQRTSALPLNVVGSSGVIASFTLDNFPVFRIDKKHAGNVKPGISLPSSASIFVDAGAYLFGKGVYLIFVGTGIIFSKTLEEGSFGYLDTTSVFGTITDFGYLDYSDDENMLYLMGRGSDNKIKVGRLEIGDLFEYTDEGAVLPNLKMSNVPGWIKAKEAAT